MSGEQPFLQIVRGTPTPEELAALVAVLTTTAGAAQPPAAPPARSRWSNPARLTRQPVFPGKGAWRASALPL